ncbi:hypothetical protein HZY86_04690 [Aerococcaceae bacterium DSM 111020]|nr:hypothetical protein [Aerococcaceae bacterium DSM 111020]
MSTIQPINFDQFCNQLTDLGFVIQFKSFRHRKDLPLDHDYLVIFVPNKSGSGSMIGDVCTCCVGNVIVNDYDNFKTEISLEIYDAFIELMFNFTYTDPNIKKLE